MRPLLSETIASYLELNGIIQGVKEIKNFALIAAFLQLMSLIINTFYSHKEVACHAGPLNAAGFCGCPCACSPYSARQVASYVELDGRGCGRTLDEGAARHQRECMRVACHAGPFNAAGLCGCLCARSPYSARQAASYLELDSSVCGRTLDEGAASLACAALTSAGHQQFFGGYRACSKLLGICEIPLQLQGL